MTDIQKFYAGKCVFVTGGTGFMGKVLVEKMLRCLPQLDKIYLLVRAKRGKLPEQRIKTMFELPMFERLRQENPSAMKKIVPIIGDLTLEGLGLFPDDEEILINNVSIIIHGAATLRLEAHMKEAVMQNTVGTKTLLNLALRMKKLLSFTHLSTAFCHGDIEVLEEKVYPPLRDPYEIIELVTTTDSEKLIEMEASIMAPHPNSYTFSKRLAETVVADMFDKLPVQIVRPAIVIPALREPVPGWVDSLNGPVGILAASGKGVLRTMLGNGENHAEVIPVDIAINGILSVIKYQCTKKKFSEVPVMNMTTSADVVDITWNDVLTRGRKLILNYPFEWTIWYPDGDIRTNVFMHKLIILLFHKIPAYFIDFLLLIFMQKRFMVRVQEKISVGLEVLQYFTLRKWNIKNTKALALSKNMSAEDLDIFFLDNVEYDIDDYLTKSLLGTRLYCLKENPNSIPFWKCVIKVLYVIDRSIKLYILYKLTSLLLWLFGMGHLMTIAFWMNDTVAKTKL